jgi:hypothetical protein
MRNIVRMLLAGLALASTPALADTTVVYRTAPDVFTSMPVPAATPAGLGALLGHDGISAATLNDTVDLFILNLLSNPIDFGPGKEFDLVGNLAKTKAKRMLVTMSGSIHLVRSNNYGSPDAVDMTISLTDNQQFLPMLLQFTNLEAVGGRYTLKPTSYLPDIEGIFTYNLLPTINSQYTNLQTATQLQPCADGQAPTSASLWEEHVTLELALAFTTSDGRPQKTLQMPTQKRDTVYRTNMCPGPR